MVCACLPTLRPLFRNLSPESMFRSVREFFSLRTFSSRSRGDTMELDSKVSRKQATRLGSGRDGEGAGSTVKFNNTSDSMEGEYDGYGHGEKEAEAGATITYVGDAAYGLPTQRGLETRSNRLQI